MRRIIISTVIALLVGFYLDSIFFHNVNIVGMRPDALMAIIVSIGFMLGSWRTGIIGASVGLIFDILYSNSLGITSCILMLTGIAAGLFHHKFYADNVIIPAVLAAIACFAKENFYAIYTAINGASYSYPYVLAVYILPCSLLTGLLCMLVHTIMKPLMKGYSRRIFERDMERSR